MTERKQLCTFFLDRHFLGVDVERVQEVVRHQEMTRVPLAIPEVRGLINLRGQILTAIDLRRRLELPEPPTGQLPVNIVVRTDEGAMSLQVDEVDEVLEVSEETFEDTPATLQGAVRPLIRGAYKLEHRLLLILDIDRTVKLNRDGVHAISG